MTVQLADIQRHVGVKPDGAWGPNTAGAIAKALGMPTFDRAAFLSRYVNLKAKALADADLVDAAAKLSVTTKHVRMVLKVESGGKSFDDRGRPIILFEPHIFHRQTKGRHSPASFSYTPWRPGKYPRTYDGRWEQMADAAERDERAALESASWGLFQIMGFHWQSLGYDSVQDFAERMTTGEPAQLDAVVRFINENGLAAKLRACKAGEPETCRAFAKGYNGGGYATNRYHIKMAEALR